MSECTTLSLQEQIIPVSKNGLNFHYLPFTKSCVTYLRFQCKHWLICAHWRPHCQFYTTSNPFLLNEIYLKQLCTIYFASNELSLLHLLTFLLNTVMHRTAVFLSHIWSVSSDWSKEEEIISLHLPAMLLSCKNVAYLACSGRNSVNVREELAKWVSTRQPRLKLQHCSKMQAC